PRSYPLSLHDALPIFAFSVNRCEMSRYDRTLVASQKTRRRKTSSASTSPYIAPAKAVRTAAKRPSPGSFGLKYCAQYTRTSAPRSEEHTSELQSRENL